MKKWNYYIAIAWDAQDIRYVTEINNKTNSAKWEQGKRAKALPKTVAESVAEKLNMNTFPAIVIKAPTYMEFKNKASNAEE